VAIETQLRKSDIVTVASHRRVGIVQAGKLGEARCRKEAGKGRVRGAQAMAGGSISIATGGLLALCGVDHRLLD
jgi:hypothetical protein